MKILKDGKRNTIWRRFRLQRKLIQGTAMSTSHTFNFVTDIFVIHLCNKPVTLWNPFSN